MPACKTLVEISLLAIVALIGPSAICCITTTHLIDPVLMNEFKNQKQKVVESYNYEWKQDLCRALIMCGCLTVCQLAVYHHKIRDLARCVCVSG